MGGWGGGVHVLSLLDTVVQFLYFSSFFLFFCTNFFHFYHSSSLSFFLFYRRDFFFFSLGIIQGIGSSEISQIGILERGFRVFFFFLWGILFFLLLERSLRHGVV